MTRHNTQQYDKLYYEQNKQNIAIQLKQHYQNIVKHKTFNCQCGSIIKYNSKSNHFKSKKHNSYINLISI
jgi:hypothetical protein